MKDFENTIAQQEREIEELRQISEDQEYLKEENNSLREICRKQKEKIEQYEDLQEQIEGKFGEVMVVDAIGLSW